MWTARSFSLVFSASDACREHVAFLQVHLKQHVMRTAR